MASNNFFDNLNIGDKITRVIGFPKGVSMEVIVGEIKDDYIICGSSCGFVKGVEGIGWKFHKKTGLEIDEDLGWDGITKSGAYIDIKISAKSQAS